MLLKECFLGMPLLFFVLKAAFHRDSLNQLWNELVKDGEILTREENYGILNSTGVIARKGQYDNVFIMRMT